jgi:trehalose-6-phosphatase
MSVDSVRSLGPEKSAPSVSLFLDFDGTLAPIRSDPSSVQLSSSQIAVLLDLSSFIPVFVMSGRAYTDIYLLIAVDSLSGLS